MTDDQGKTKKEAFVGRLEKTKGRLQQSFPEIQQRVRTSNAVEVAQSIFRQFADDIQLKDLLAKAEALLATVSKETAPAQTFRDVTPSAESSGTAPVKTTPVKRARVKKAQPKKTVSKKKKPAPKHRRHARATG
jgi:hypothetical protein